MNSFVLFCVFQIATFCHLSYINRQLTSYFVNAEVTPPTRFQRPFPSLETSPWSPGYPPPSRSFYFLFLPSPPPVRYVVMGSCFQTFPPCFAYRFILVVPPSLEFPGSFAWLSGAALHNRGYIMISSSSFLLVYPLFYLSDTVHYVYSP